MSAEAERMIREMYASVSKMYVRHERDWGDALADMYGWTRPLPIETGPVDPDTGEAPIKWQALNDAVVNVYGQLFFGSNYGAGPAVISQLGKLADGSGIDPEVVRQAVATAVGQANEAFVASIRGEVLAAVGEDNADLADDIVARIGAALAQPEGTL